MYLIGRECGFHWNKQMYIALTYLEQIFNYVFLQNQF